MKQRYTIIHVLSSFADSGRKMVALTLLDKLDSARLEQSLAVLEGEPRVEGKIRFFGRKEGLDLRLLCRLRRHFRRVKPEIIHTHGSLADFYGILAARLAGIRNVVTTCHRGDFSQEKCFRSRMRNRILFSLAKTVVCVSKHQMHHLRQSYPRLQSKFQQIYLGTELTDVWNLPPLPEQLPDNPIVLCTGHIRFERDHEMLLRAFQKLYAAFPCARLHLAGTGEQERIDTLKRLVETLGVTPAVEFLGFRTDIPQLLGSAWVFVHPAKWDALPRSVIEASAAGRPIVATNVGGLPEIVAHKETGILVPAGDATAMANALIELCEYPATAVRMGKAGRERARRIFGIDPMLATYEQLYESLLGASSSH